jgi:hypothetical protein
MKGVTERKAEQKRLANADRERRKRAKAPVVSPVMIGDTLVTVALSEIYAPILERAEDTRLLDIATKYNIPLTQEQAFLVQEGDTLLPQFEKIQIDTEKQMELLGKGYSPLSSSNIAAVKIDGADLLILFHSGDEYRYPNKAEMYYPFNEALSPGRLLHRTIRFATGYSKE